MRKIFQKCETTNDNKKFTKYERKFEKEASQDDDRAKHRNKEIKSSKTYLAKNRNQNSNSRNTINH